MQSMVFSCWSTSVPPPRSLHPVVPLHWYQSWPIWVEGLLLQMVLQRFKNVRLHFFFQYQQRFKGGDWNSFFHQFEAVASQSTPSVPRPSIVDDNVPLPIIRKLILFHVELWRIICFIFLLLIFVHVLYCLRHRWSTVRYRLRWGHGRAC